jgi:GNAT superfamily N-acetyltransferase
MRDSASSAKLTTRNLIVRQASDADIPAILDCLLTAFAPYKKDYSTEAFADTVLTPATLHKRLQTMRVLVALDYGKVVGTVAGAVNHSEGHLRGMAVLPEFHGCGVSKLLLAKIETWLQAQGCTRITLDTTQPLQQAMRFYEKNGYRRSGRTEDFFGMPLMEYRKDCGNPGASSMEKKNLDAADNYQARILGYVAGKDPLEMQGQAPRKIAALIANVPPEQLRRRPAPRKWSAVEIIAHLAEDELASGWRYRQMIEHPGCNLGSFDQDLWAQLGKYELWSPDDALAMFRLLRTANLQLLKNLTAEQWESFGLHPERGKITVRDLAIHMAGHDMNHIRQIAGLIDKGNLVDSWRNE